MFGFVVLVVTLIMMAGVQMAAALGTMYVLHQKRPLPDLLLRYAAIAVPSILGFALMGWLFGDDASKQMFILFLLAMAAIPLIAALNHLKQHVTSSVYGTLDFENFQLASLQELITRLAIIFLPLTFIIHVLDYLFVGRLINRYTFVVGFTLFLLEIAGIAAGFALVLKLEKERVILLTITGGLVYLAILGFLISKGMLF